MRKSIRFLLPVVLLLCGWLAVSSVAGSELVPQPMTVFRELVSLTRGELWSHLCLTLFRGAVGMGLALVAALLLGLLCGFLPGTMSVLAPLVTAMQCCPPIIWISLLLVWLSTGTAVPVFVVFAAVFPAAFLNIAQAVSSRDRHLFEMAKLYHVPRHRVFFDLLIPGISHSALASLSFAFGITWKVAATAEFFGAPSGMGARIYWAYRNLEMPQLFAWTTVIIIIGLLLEMGIVQPLRETLHSEAEGGKTNDPA